MAWDFNFIASYVTYYICSYQEKKIYTALQTEVTSNDAQFGHFESEIGSFGVYRLITSHVFTVKRTAVSTLTSFL